MSKRYEEMQQKINILTKDLEDANMKNEKISMEVYETESKM